MSKFWLVFIIISSLILLWALVSFFMIKDVETLKYSLVEEREQYEIREYDPYTIARTKVSGSYREGINEGFLKVLEYISGQNNLQQKISMTSPVIESFEGVFSLEDLNEETQNKNSRFVSFVMPESFKIEELPLPDSDEIEIIGLSGGKFAVMKFSWWPTENRVSRKKKDFLKIVAKDGLVPLSEPMLARYNPPMSAPFIMRNEILIPLR